MAHLPALLVGLLIGPAFAQSPEPAKPNDFTAATWAECAACHAAPDRRVRHDARWIGLNRTTACLTGEAATDVNRKRLISFLQEGMGTQPLLIQGSTTAAQEGDGEVGTVQVPANSGSAFVRRIKGGAKETLRLFWEESERGGVLAVPAGEYELIGYCLYRSEEGIEWTASATIQEGTKADRFKVASNGAVKLPFGEAMYHDLQVTAEGPKLQIQFQMRNEAGDRMTLTRGGDLVEPTWVAYDEGRAHQLASGPFVPT